MWFIAVLMTLLGVIAETRDLKGEALFCYVLSILIMVIELAKSGPIQ